MIFHHIQNNKFVEIREKALGKFEKETSLFNHINKYINDDLPNISILDDQNIFIGAKEGFIKYDTKKSHLINENFKVLVRSIQIKSDKDSLKIINPAFEKAIKLNKDESIKIDFASPYFDGFEDLRTGLVGMTKTKKIMTTYLLEIILLK